MPLDPRERAHELCSVVHAGDDDDLDVHFETRIEDGLEHLHAPCRVLSHEALAYVRAHRMQGDMQGREMAFDDAGKLVVIHVGQGHEVTLEKREAIVVIAQVQGRTHVLRQHGHEAEDAGITAGDDAIEDAVIENDAPILPQLTIDVGEAPILERQLDVVAIGLPAPLDEVTQRHVLDMRDDHAARKPRPIGRRTRLDTCDARTTRLGMRLRLEGAVGTRFSLFV